MSKGGGAGKVYFILYLAVLLELLIIIVERDDAEEELRKEKEELLRKTKRIQLIAETIINSLRGPPTAVSSTSDQSMVLGDKNEANGREFNVRIRLADPMRDTVKELDLHILRNNAEMATINLAADSTQYPRIRDGNDLIFKYAFKPQFGAGEYKLHFDARTNQIVGVTQSASPEDTVKIGAVHLTVKELKEVKDGIQENISLRGYIDSLLGGGYQNFAANIGSNEFTVNVKPPAEVDQLKIFPQEADFAAFPGLELPNPVKIEGATIGGPQGTNITKIDGPGEIKKIDSNYFWVWKPDAAAVGQTYTVHILGKANRNGADKDNAKTQFTVSVKKLEFANASHFFPENKKSHEGMPYTAVTFTANEKYANLDGTYRTEIYLNGVKVATKDEPTAEFQPEFMKDEGKQLEVKAYYKSNFMKDFVQLDDQTFKIGPPPLQAAVMNDGMTGGDALEIKAAYNLQAPVAGNPLGQYKEIGSDHLDIQSDGYFENTARKQGGKEGIVIFDAKATSKAQNVRSKDGQVVNVTVTDPVTGQTKSMQVTVFPKVQKKGPGARSGGSGIQ
jgi:hypothetical protein